jgi:hypothetical protein
MKFLEIFLKVFLGLILITGGLVGFILACIYYLGEHLGLLGVFLLAFLIIGIVVAYIETKHLS